MKILSIGNSFSQDAQRWLHPLSKCSGTEIDTVNLFIGGCSLEAHYDNIINDRQAYDYEGNEIIKIKRSSIKEALEEDTYDVVTVQQVSGDSGHPQTFFPYLTEVVNYAREKQPEATLYYHKTWSYEIDSTHDHFAGYNSDRSEMFRRITDCSLMASKICDLKIIPTGDFIEYLRNNIKEFDYKNGGMSLNRDGFHLSLSYGRFAAAALWYKTLTGQKVNSKRFAEENPDFDINITNLIADSLEKFWEVYSKNAGSV